MRRLLARQRAVLLLGLLLLVGGVVGGIAAARDAQSHAGPRLASQSVDPGGALGLALWLERLGYRVKRLQAASATAGDADGIYFVLDAIRPFTRTEAGATLGWVRRGGTLVIIPSPGLDEPLQKDLGIAIRYSSARIRARCYNKPGCVDPAIRPALAFFTRPPAVSFAATGATELQFGDDDWAPLIVQSAGTSSAVLVATRQFGSGRVYAIADTSYLSNEGINQADNSVLVLNILARARGTRTVAFDEAHTNAPAAADVFSAARDAPWGWAFGYLAVVTFLFAAWGGRRFGPAVVPEPPPGRSGGEYVTAFAGLLRRQPDAPAWAQRELARLIRRRLVRRHGLPVELSTEELVEIVAERQRIEPDDLDFAMHALEGRKLGEKALLNHLAAIDRCLGDKP